MMNSFFAKTQARRPVRICLFACAILLGHQPGSLPAAPVEPLFAPPTPAQLSPVVEDEIILLSTRAVGTRCNDQSMARGLRCQRIVMDTERPARRLPADWRQVFTVDKNTPTLFYVHGNRVAEGRDLADGLRVYQSFRSHRHTTGPVRFVIWSWPSEQIRGPIKDYLIKAQRTNPVAWQFAWFLDQLPVETPISLVGYSYGTRVVSGATHLLAGGHLGSLKLTQRAHPDRAPLRAALLAAAYDADWIQPGEFYCQSLAMTKNLVLATNEHDPAMRFYHLSNGRGRIHALGKSGVRDPRSLGSALWRLQLVDFTDAVGRSHALQDYLAADGKMGVLWDQLLRPATAASRSKLAVTAQFH